MKDTDITVLPDSPEFGEHRNQVNVVHQAAETYEVKSQEDVNMGERLLRDIRTAEVGLGERKSEITRPIMKSLASVRDLFRPIEDRLADSKKIIKDKILTFTLANEEQFEAERQKIADKVVKGQLRPETAAGKLEVVGKGKVKSNVRTIQKLVITDESLIPRQYMDVNRIKVTEALWAGIPVPGAELKEEKTIVTK